MAYYTHVDLIYYDFYLHGVRTDTFPAVSLSNFNGQFGFSCSSSSTNDNHRHNAPIQNYT